MLPIPCSPGLAPFCRPWGEGEAFGNGLTEASGHSEEAPAALAAFSLALGSGGAEHPSAALPRGAGRSRLLPGREHSVRGSALPGPSGQEPLGRGSRQRCGFPKGRDVSLAGSEPGEPHPGQSQSLHGRTQLQGSGRRAGGAVLLCVYILL